MARTYLYNLLSYAGGEVVGFWNDNSLPLFLIFIICDYVHSTIQLVQCVCLNRGAGGGSYQLTKPLALK